MSAGKLFESIKSVSEILRALELAGITVEVGDDFAKFRSFRARQSDRATIYPMFDVTCSYIDKNNGFWICGFDPNGLLIHTQAVRLLDLSDVTLAQHLTLHRHKYITPDTTPDPNLTFYKGPRSLDRITGMVCYQGDFWLSARGLGGPRSQGATELLSRVLFEIMVGCWEPNYVFALVPKKLAVKGAHLRYGYTHCEPGRWVGPDKQVTEEDYLIWMGADDIANALSKAPQSLQAGQRIAQVRSPITPIDVKK